MVREIVKTAGEIVIDEAARFIDARPNIARRVTSAGIDIFVVCSVMFVATFCWSFHTVNNGRPLRLHPSDIREN